MSIQALRSLVGSTKTGRRLRRLLKRQPPPLSVDMMDSADAAVIDRYNVAAEKYFQAMSDPAFLLNKPFCGIDIAPTILYRFAILLASLDLGYHRVLDFGAGSCWVSSILNRMGCRTVAVDVSETALRLGQQAFACDRRQQMHLQPQFVVYDGVTLPFADSSMDRIICFDAFHHIPNKQAILNEMYRVLAQGGRVAFAEPGAGHAHSADAISETENHGVLEDNIDLDKLIVMGERAGFTQVWIKPYPPPAAIAFTADQYRRFARGRDGVFPLHVVRNDLAANSMIVMQRGEAPIDSRRPGVLRADLELDGAPKLRVSAGQSFTLKVRVTNTGDTIWRYAADLAGGYVQLGAHLRDVSKRVLDDGSLRGALTADVAPGGAQHVAITLTAPPTPGAYVFELDMVCEMVAWFGQRGSATLPVAVEVG